MKFFFAALLLTGFSYFSLTAQVSNEQYVRIPNKKNAMLTPAQSVGFSGYLGQKMEQCIDHRIKAQDIDLLVEPFRHRTESRWWQSEFWGKWMLSAAKAYEYSLDDELLAQMKASVKEMLATQSADGYIGNYAAEHHLKQWDVWGRKYTLLGLLYWYDLSEDTEALQGAVNLADHLLTEVGPGKANIVRTGNYRGMASSSILEPMILLYQRTGHQRYLDFAEYIVQQWESEQGPMLISKAMADVPVAGRFAPPPSWWSWENGMKAYEMMSCYDGLLKLYQITGREQYLEAVRKTYDNIRRTEINLAGSGASMECWYGGADKQIYPAKHSMETCVTMTWMKLGYELYRLTGDAAIVDEVEKSAYNNLLGSMSPKGETFCKYSGMEGFRSEGEDQCEMPINCCVANGPRGLMLLPDLAVMSDAEGLVVNLYQDLRAAAQLPNGHWMGLRISGDYPIAGKVNISLQPEQVENFTLKLRIPQWSQLTQLWVNGEAQEVDQSGQYLELSGNWKQGDEITLELDLRGRVVTMRDSEHLRTYHAIQRGPILLAYDNRFGDAQGWNVSTPVRNADGLIDLEPIQLEGVWMAFRAPFNAPGEKEKTRKISLPLVDFSSAGNAWEYGNYYQVFIPQAYDPSAK